MNKHSVKKLEKQVNTTMPKEIKLTVDIHWCDPDGGPDEIETREIMFYPKPKSLR